MVLVWCGVLHFAASSLTRFWSTETGFVWKGVSYRGGVLGIVLVVAVVVGRRGEDCKQHNGKQARH